MERLERLWLRPMQVSWRRRGVFVLISLAVSCSSGCGGDDKPTTAESTMPATAPLKRGAPRDPDHPVVELATSAGAIRVKLDRVSAPNTVQNFLFYLKQGFYDDTLIHYVAADKMIVGGGYDVDLQPKQAGMTVRNEAHNGLKNRRGTIAMARDAASGIDSATSQFFINLVDSPNLDHRGDDAAEYGYCVFGEVVDGLAVADEISHATTRDQGGDLAQTPEPPVVVKSIRIVE